MTTCSQILCLPAEIYSNIDRRTERCDSGSGSMDYAKKLLDFCRTVPELPSTMLNSLLECRHSKATKAAKNWAVSTFEGR